MEEFINADTIRNILTYEDLIPLMEKALCKFSDNCVVQPVRSVVPVENEGGYVFYYLSLCLGFSFSVSHHIYAISCGVKSVR